MSPPPSDGGALVCTVDTECDDGIFCNGEERCAPDDPGADPDGCVAATDLPCDSGESCDEEAESCETVCPDADGDGHADLACGGDDCDDDDPGRYPGNTEVCDADGEDEDCNPLTFGFQDLDGDGAPSNLCCNAQADGSLACGDDCDDMRSTVHPGSTEACDGFDNDCDGVVDEGVLNTYWIDADGDGFGSAAAGSATMEACARPSGFSDTEDDCNDDNGAINPAADEVCSPDLVDENCSGAVNEGCPCVTGEGRSCSGLGACAGGTQDCVDGTWGTCSVTPQSEICNGDDDDCDGATDEGMLTVCYADGDDDGYAELGASSTEACFCGSGSTFREPTTESNDCDDSDNSQLPGATERCNAEDDDCDGLTDESLALVTRYIDTDGDGAEGTAVDRCEGDPNSAANSSDCNESDDTVYDGAPELCDGKDNDCSLLTGAGGADTAEDQDGDEFAPIGAACDDGPFPKTDCLDTDATAFPGNSETCDGVDNDCNDTIDDAAVTDPECDAGVANGTAICLAGSCALASCEPGFADCDQDGAYGSGGGFGMNGCEVDLTSDAGSCGSCGTTCLDTCNDGRCTAVANGVNGAFRATMAFVSTGEVVGAGLGNELELPSNASLVTPVGVTGTLAQVDDACGVRTDGTVTCWSGVVDPVGFSGTAVGISAALGNACATRDDGTVWCWGNNQEGQLGDGVEDHPQDCGGFDCSDTPVQVVGISDAVLTSTGYAFSCALHEADGAVSCWGGASGGRLGIGGVTPSNTPIDTGVRGAIDLASTELYTCALMNDATLTCWGTIGGTTTTSPTPLPSLDQVARIGSGRFHICAVRTDGTVHCWGENGTSQLGDGGTVDSDSPIQVDRIDDAVEVSGGENHTCVTRTTGSLACWSSFNEFGWLGDGTLSGHVAPATVHHINEPIELLTAFNMMCGRRQDLQATCWGLEQPSSGANLFSDASVYRDVDAGPGHVCGVLFDGTVRCFGTNTQGQLGDGTTTDRPDGVMVMGLTDAVEITTGDRHTCALRAGGLVSCWGRPDRLGLSTTDPVTTPMEMPALADAVQIEARRGTIVRHRDGSVTSWDDKRYTEPTRVPGIRGAQDVAVGGVGSIAGHACALLYDGTVWCWGDGSNGAVGDGDLASFWRRDPTQVVGLTDIVDIEAGGEHTCAIDRAGAVFCWGKNDHGQIGDSSLDTRATPVGISMPPARHLDLDFDYTCALSESLDVYCWGENNSWDRLGVGTTDDVLVPTLSAWW